MPLRRSSAALAFVLVLASQLLAQSQPVYDESADAGREIKAAIVRASKTGKKNVVLVFGANWCTDCRALDAHMHSPELAAMIEKNFLVVKALRPGSRAVRRCPPHDLRKHQSLLRKVETEKVEKAPPGSPPIALQRGLLGGAPLEEFDVAVDEGNGGGGDAGDARSLSEGERADARQLLHDFARKPGNLVVIEPVGDATRFGALHPLDLLLLLLEIAFVLEIRLDAPGFFGGK